MNKNDIMDLLKDSSPFPIYAIYGEEDYLREKAVKILINRFVDKSTMDFNFDILRGDELEVNVLYNRLMSVPMMSERRVVYIKNGHLLNKLAKNTLIKYAETPNDFTILIVESEELFVSEKNIEKLKKNIYKCEFKRLYPNQIPFWVINYVKSKGKYIERETVDNLVELCGSGLREITNEIDKILIFIGEKKSIEKNDVVEVTGSSKYYNIFELCDAVSEKNIGRSLKIIYEMIERGEELVGIITMLSRHMKILLKIKEIGDKYKSNELAHIVGVRPYYINNYMKHSTLFSVSEIEKSFNILLSGDILLKSNMKNKNLLMELLIIQMISCQQPKDYNPINKCEIFRELLDVYSVR